MTLTLGYSKNHQPIPLSRRRWLVWNRVHAGEVSFTPPMNINPVKFTDMLKSCALQPLTGKIYTHFSNKAS